MPDKPKQPPAEPAPKSEREQENPKQRDRLKRAAGVQTREGSK